MREQASRGDQASHGPDDAGRTVARWLHLLPGLGIAAIAVVALRSIAAPAFWMHLAAGRHIAAEGLARTDPFSFVLDGARWVHGSWLYDRALFTTWNLVGAPGIVLLHAAMIAAAAALLIRAARPWSGPAGVTAAAVLSAWLLALTYRVGPQAPALLLAALFVRLLADGPPGRRRLAVLALLQVLWTQVHLSFPLGPAIALLAWADRRAGARTRTSRRPGLGTPAMARDLAPAGILAAVTLLNPYGLALHRAAWHALARPTAATAGTLLSPLQALFRPLPVGHLFTVALLIGAVGLVAQKARLPATLTALAMGAALVVLRIPGTLPFFALLAIPFLALSLRAAGESGGEILRSRLRLRLMARPWVAAAASASLALFTLLAFAGGTFDRAAGTLSRPGLRAETEPFPAAAAALIEDPWFPERAFNLPFDGGYLAWAHPHRRVFIDPRTDRYDAGMQEQVARALAGDRGAWETLETTWPVEAVILSCFGPGSVDLARRLLDSPRWALGYFDGVTAVLLRPETAAAPSVRAHAVAGLERLEAEVRAAEARVRRGQRPHVAPRLAGAGFFFAAMGRHEEAARILALVERASPRMAAASLQRARSLARLGRHEQAVALLEAQVARNPRSRGAWALLAESRAALGHEDDAHRARARADALAGRQP